VRGTFDGTILAFGRVPRLPFRSSEPRAVLPSGTRSFSTYLFFINTKTRQPVGFQSTDIVD
jgi:hypothetical protein